MSVANLQLRSEQEQLNAQISDLVKREDKMKPEDTKVIVQGLPQAQWPEAAVKIMDKGDLSDTYLTPI